MGRQAGQLLRGQHLRLTSALHVHMHTPAQAPTYEHANTFMHIHKMNTKLVTQHFSLKQQKELSMS